MAACPSQRPIRLLRASSTDLTAAAESSPWLNAEPTETSSPRSPVATTTATTAVRIPTAGCADGVEGECISVEQLLDGAQGGLTDEPETCRSGRRSRRCARVLLAVPLEANGDRRPGAFGEFVDAEDGRAIVVGGKGVAPDLDDRDGIALDGDPESGQRQRLDVAHDLLGGPVGGGEDVDGFDRVCRTGHAYRLHRWESGQRLFEFLGVHCLRPPIRHKG